MNRRELENTAFNIKMMDSDPDALLKRFDAMAKATDAIRQAYLSQQPEGYELPADFESAVNYAMNALYRIGSAVCNPDDAARALHTDIEYRKLKKAQDNSDEWIPETTNRFGLARDLLVQGSYLSIEDKQPAYQAHPGGRNHESLDPYSTWYNKFGAIVTRHAQQ